MILPSITLTDLRLRTELVSLEYRDLKSSLIVAEMIEHNKIPRYKDDRHHGHVEGSPECWDKCGDFSKLTEFLEKYS